MEMRRMAGSLLKNRRTDAYVFNTGNCQWNSVPQGNNKSLNGKLLNSWLWEGFNSWCTVNCKARVVKA